MTNSTCLPEDKAPAQHRKKLPHLPELDGLRGLAAVAVFFHHFMQLWEYFRPAGPSRASLLAGVVASYGYLGVDVFFVLSGFLITSLLLTERTAPNYFHNFYWKRVLRILPVYMVHLVACALLFKNMGGYILLSTLFVVNFASLLHMPVSGPNWSLSIEEQFYLVWPHVIRNLKLHMMYYVAFALIVFSVVARVAVPLWHGGINLQYTFYRCDGLALGAVLALQWYSTDGRTRAVRAVLRLLNSNWTLLLVLGIQAIVFVRFRDFRFGSQLLFTSVNYSVYRLIRFILTYRNKAGFVLAWLGSPVAVYLGAISYALYMYQWFVFAEFEQSFQINNIHGWKIPLAFAVTFASCVVICVISRYSIELPTQKLRRFVLKPSSPSAIAANP